MVIIDIVINTILGRLTLDPAGMHCLAWDDAFVSIYSYYYLFTVCDADYHREVSLLAHEPPFTKCFEQVL